MTRVHRWEVVRDNTTANLRCRGREEGQDRIVAFVVSGRWTVGRATRIRLVVSAFGLVVALQRDVGQDVARTGGSLPLGTQSNRVFRSPFHLRLRSAELRHAHRVPEGSPSVAYSPFGHSGHPADSLFRHALAHSEPILPQPVSACPQFVSSGRSQKKLLTRRSIAAKMRLAGTSLARE